MSITVAILTPSEGLSGSIAKLLSNQPDIDVTVVSSEKDVAIRQLQLADVALLHHGLPREVIFRVLRTLRFLPGRTCAVVAGVPKAGDIVARYLENGATAYTLEEESRTQIIDVIRRAGAGQARVDPWLAPRIIERYRELQQKMTETGMPDIYRPNCDGEVR